MALAPTPPRASTPAMAISTRIGTYGLIIGPSSRVGTAMRPPHGRGSTATRPPPSVVGSCSRRNPRQGGDQAVRRLTSAWLVHVGEQFHDQPHQGWSG